MDGCTLRKGVRTRRARHDAEVQGFHPERAQGSGEGFEGTNPCEDTNRVQDPPDSGSGPMILREVSFGSCFPRETSPCVSGFDAHKCVVSL